MKSFLSVDELETIISLLNYINVVVEFICVVHC